MSAGQGEAVPIAKEVQEIILICLMGILVYVVMVCCILCRKPPSRAEPFDCDVDEAEFVSRKPEDPEGYYFAQSEPRVIFEAAASHCGRFMVDRGQARYSRENGVSALLDRSKYGVFSAGEKFTFSDADEEFLFHLDIYRGDLRPVAGVATTHDKID